MSFLKGFAVAAVLFMGASAAMAGEDKFEINRIKNHKIIDRQNTLEFIFGYACTVKSYDDNSSETSDLIEPFYVMIDRESDPVPAEAIPVESVSYNITRVNGSIVVEANGEGNPGQEFIVPDGTPVGIIMKKEKQILTCTPPRINEATMQLFVNPSHQRLVPNPHAYGESIQMLWPSGKSIARHGTDKDVVREMLGTSDLKERLRIFNEYISEDPKEIRPLNK